MVRTSRTHRSVCLAITAVALTLAARTIVHAQQSATYDIVSSFEAPYRAGRAPSSLRQADDGAFYGTTRLGGAFDGGTIFRMDASGVITPVYDFTGGPDGAAPFGLVSGADGAFYGLTSSGAGTVFRFAPGSGLTTVHGFSSTDGQVPVDLFTATDGNVYGLTRLGGDFGTGTIFMLAPGGGFSRLYSFPADIARYALRSLVRANDGRFYVTAGGGSSGAGALFSIDTAGSLTVFRAFSFADGQGRNPIGLIQGRDGRLYGTTSGGGDHNDGTVYSIGLAGDYTLLHSLSLLVEGSQPGPDLVEASDGNFYGVTTGRETLFSIDAAGTTTTLHRFGGAPGELIQAADGRLFGTTEAGRIYTLDLSGTLTILYEFTVGDSDGRPNGVIQTRGGTFYGTTVIPIGEGRIGTVFAMDDVGARTSLHSFFFRASGFVNDGTPSGNLFEAADGSVYGATYAMADFPNPPGQIYRITPQGLFSGVTSVSGVTAGVIQARDGRLYGTSATGYLGPGRPFYGDIWRIDPSGSRTVLHQLDGTDSVYPIGELVEIDDGSLYGTTEGGIVSLSGGGSTHRPAGIFQVDPATGALTFRAHFATGVKPAGRLVQGTDGILYGTTINGGATGLGTVFSLDVAGALTTFHEFSGADGANPNAGVIQGLDGRLYGTTRNGGRFGYGTVFVVNVTGGLTTLHDFSSSDGANPIDELFQTADGAFYGAASTAGPRGGGVIFRLRLETTPPPTDGYVEIVSRHSGKCLDVAGGSTEAGATVLQWACHGGPNQQWRVEPLGFRTFRITNRYSGQALDVAGGALDDGAAILQWPLHGGDNQLWTIEPLAGGYFHIFARHSSKAMDVEFGSTSDGARVLQWSPHSGANQQWLLRPIGSAVTPVTSVSQR